jgi:hypothetical protein
VRLVKEKIIVMAAYGDDHAWSWPQILQNVLNVKLYEEFLWSHFRIILREGEEYDNFCTTINEKNEIVKKGVCFLKRYFVKTTEPDLPPVIAFKETREIMTSLCLKEYDSSTDTDVDAVDILLSCIGQAYDAQYNRVAYDAVRDVFDKVLSRHGIPDLEEAINKALYDPNKRTMVTKLMRSFRTRRRSS